MFKTVISTLVACGIGQMASAAIVEYELFGSYENLFENTRTEGTLLSLSFNTDETPFELKNVSINYSFGFNPTAEILTATQDGNRLRFGGLIDGSLGPPEFIPSWFSALGGQGVENSVRFSLDENGDVSDFSFSLEDYQTLQD